MDSPDTLAVTRNLLRRAQPGRTAFFRLHPSAENAFPLAGKKPAGMPIERGKASGPFPIERPGVDALPVEKKPLSGDAQAARIRKAASGFESIFLRHLLNTMRTTVPGGGLYGSGSSGEIYADMMENALAEVMSSRDDLGIAGMIAGRIAKTSQGGAGAAKMPTNEAKPAFSVQGTEILSKERGRE